MNAGKLAAAKPAATTNITLYRSPINEATSAVLEVCNQSASGASYRAALRDYDQVLTLDSASYAFRSGNVVSNYKLTLSPGISTDQFDPGDNIILDNSQGNFAISDIDKPTATLTYPTKVRRIGNLPINSSTQTGLFALGDTITGATTGLTAVIYRVTNLSLNVEIAPVSAGATSVYINNVTGVLANDFLSTGGEIMQISAITGYNITVTRGQLGTTAVEQIPGSTANIFRGTATTTTINEGATFSASDTTLTVTSATGIVIGDYLRIDNEILQVSSVSNLDIAVTRGAFGSIAATHTDGATVTLQQFVTTANFQFFVFDEIIDNGNVTTAPLNISGIVGSNTAFTSDLQFVFDFGSGAYQHPENIPIDADRIVRFTQVDSSNTGYPLRISTTPDGTNSVGGTAWTTGVTIAGTPGSSGSYIEIVFSVENILSNISFSIYSPARPQMSSGNIQIDLTPNYSQVYIYDPSKTITTSDTFRLNNVNYTITAVTPGPYGYVRGFTSTALKVSLGKGSSSFAGTNTFYDSPLTPADARTLATVSSVSVINDEDYIYYEKSVSANSTDRTTGLVVGPGQSIMVYSSVADLSYVLQGFSDTTSDFAVVHYIRERPASV